MYVLYIYSRWSGVQKTKTIGTEDVERRASIIPYQ